MPYEESAPRRRRTPSSALAHARRRVLLHRRGLAALLLAAGVAASLSAVRAPATPTRQVWVAAHDLDGGHTLAPSDVRRSAALPGSVPDGTLSKRDLVGHRLAAPVRAGEPFTDRRVVGHALLAAYPGRSAVPVRMADPGVAALLRPGQRVDLLSTDPREAGSAVRVATDAIVLTVVSDKSDGALSTSATAGPLALVAVDEEDATNVADAGAKGFLTTVFAR